MNKIYLIELLRVFKYLFKCIFLFLRSGVVEKRGVEFLHLTRNASRIRRKEGKGVKVTEFSLSTLLRDRVCGIQREVDFFLIVIVNNKTKPRHFTTTENFTSS